MSVTISNELFKALAPKSRNYTPDFPLDQPIKLVGLDEDDLVDWGDKLVPQIILGDGSKVPAPKIFNMILLKPGLIHNEGMSVPYKESEKSLECVDFAGNTLYDHLEQKYGDKDIVLPDEIIPKSHMNKGIKFSSVTSEYKKELYEKSWYANGKTFDDAFNELEFIPSIRESKTGTLRNNACTILAPIE